MKILYLAHRIPYPPNKGDKIRTFNEIKYLSANHTVDLICLADDPEDLQYKEALQKYCRKVFVRHISTRWSKIRGMAGFCFGKSISVIYFYRKAVQKIFNQWLEADNYGAVICFSSPMAEYIFQSAHLRKGKVDGSASKSKLIMDFCDVDSDKWLQYSQEASFPLKQVYQAENIRLQTYEKKVYQAFDSSTLVSEQEKILFLKMCPGAHDLIAISNGVDTTYFSPDFSKPVSVSKQQPTLVFTGAMDYHANVDGVCWFCHDIFPGLKKKFPELHFYIVGRHPAAAVKKLAEIEGVFVTGNVEDIRPWYDKADIIVVPLRLARGVQNKVLEAMAMSRPVVSTSKVNVSINAKDNEHIRVADTADDFTAAITELLTDHVKKEKIAENARSFVLQNYDWDTNMKQLEALLPI